MTKNPIKVENSQPFLKQMSNNLQKINDARINVTTLINETIEQNREDPGSVNFGNFINKLKKEMQLLLVKMGISGYLIINYREHHFDSLFCFYKTELANQFLSAVDSKKDGYETYEADQNILESIILDMDGIFDRVIKITNERSDKNKTKS